MVSKRMLLAMADTFLAIILFLSGGHVEPHFVMRTTQSQFRHAGSLKEAANDDTERHVREI